MRILNLIMQTSNEIKQSLNPPKGSTSKINVRSKWMVFAVTGLANLGAAFAINSLNLALPILREDFGVTQSDVSWLALVYSLIPCCTLLLFGRMADLYGYKRQFSGGFAFFAVVSMLAPLLSKNLVTLIGFRALQGLGYSMLISITQAAVYRAFGEKERGKALGINSVFVSVGLASGPSIGGFLLRHFSWHSIFFFAAGFAVLGFIGTLLCMEDDTGKDRSVKMDYLGGLCFALFIGAFSVGLNFSDEWGFWSVKFAAAMLLSAAGLVLFILRESRTGHPLMALGLFKIRTFSFSNGASALSYVTQQMTTYLFPFFLADVLLLQTDQAGLVMLTTPVIMMIVSPFGGSLSDRLGTKFPAVSGLLLIAAACVGIGFFNTGTALVWVILALAIIGAGNGLSVAAINSAILGSAPKAQSGVASGMLATMRNVGQTLGVAIGSVMLTVRQGIYTSGGFETAGAHLMAQRDALYLGAGLALLAAGLIAGLPKKTVSTVE